MAWRLPRKLEDIKVGRYSLRIRNMFEKLKELRESRKLPAAKELEQQQAEKKVQKKKD